jgi:hypothetical protein
MDKKQNNIFNPYLFLETKIKIHYILSDGKLMIN